LINGGFLNRIRDSSSAGKDWEWNSSL